MVGVNPGKNVTSHFTKLEIMPLKMLLNYGILKLFLETYGKDEIDNIVPSHNYDTKKNCCALVSNCTSTCWKVG